jgi:hypothetical protein
MRSGTLFWGVVLLLLGGLFLLNNLGILPMDIWGVLWPTLLIALGVWVLWGVLLYRGPASEHADILLEGARQADLSIKHGAGRLSIKPGTSPGELVHGDFAGGVEVQKRRDGETLNVTLSVRSQFWMPPVFWRPPGLDWTLNVSKEIPLRLNLDMGANESKIDLTELQVKELNLNTGASSTELTLPALAGSTRAKIATGAASVRVRIPDGVGASIRYSSGLASVTIDQQRFPRVGNTYQSPDYEMATNKVELAIETGVGAVDVR